jgi:hypothetical protein
MHFQLKFVYVTPASEENVYTVEPSFNVLQFKVFPSLEFKSAALKETLNGGFTELNSTAN